MGRPTINASKKVNYNMSINPDIVDEFRARSGVGNLSGWVEDCMLKFNLSRRELLRCTACDVEARIEVWAGWKLRCPVCHVQHENSTSLIPVEQKKVVIE